MPVDTTGLNPAQREAVEHENGPMLVLAGAGSGKTRVVTMRIARLLGRGVHQRSILGVTFTNKAAREMRERLWSLVGKDKARGVTLSTFHSLCARMLRRDGHRIGLEGRFTILDASDQLAQLARVKKAEGLDTKEVPERLILGRIGWFKNQGFHPDEVSTAGDDVHLLARRLYGPYTAHLRQLGAVDFDDLLLLGRQLLSEVHDVRRRYQMQFVYILIDEYQDTNPVQMALVESLVGEGEHHPQNLCVVGDDDQAIYGFRGSAVENILHFDEQFPGTRVVKLEENYRSTAAILGCANALISKNETRRGKTLIAATGDGEGRPVVLLCADDGQAEAEHVAQRIKKAIELGRLPGDVAVLYRANPQSRLFEEQLRLLGVPYRVVGGQEFFERRDVKNVLAYLTLMVRPHDELSFRRVVNLPARGLGDKAVGRLVEGARAEAQGGDAPVDGATSDPDQTREPDLLAHARHASWPKPSQQDVLSRFTGPLLDATKELGREDPDDDPIQICERAVLSAGYADALAAERDLVTRDRAQSALDEVLDAFAAWWDRIMEARQHPDLAESWVVDLRAHPLESFLDRIALDEEERRRERERKKEQDKEKKDDRVTLMSIHASKGLEFESVYVVGFEEGMLPHRRVLEEDPVAGVEEERRLAYVALTRARQELTLTYARARRRRRQMLGRRPSRFVEDIGRELLTTLGEPDEAKDDGRSDQEMAADFFSKFSSS